jgi:DNA-binding CsgD family transcriptional regulator
MEIAQQAMDYRYRILRQRYLGISPERGYRNLTTRLAGLVTLRNKIRTWVSLSRDRQRAVVDVLQEVIQELLNSDRYIQNQITWIAQCTDDTRLRDALLLTSIEEYCLRPIRNQPLLVYRFVNFLRRSQRGGMTHVPEGDLVRVVSEEVTLEETDAPVSLLDHQALVDYQDKQAISEQQALGTLVKQELSSYLEQKLGPTAVNWLHLYLKGQSQEDIARSLNLPIQEVHRLREEITYHAIGVFALKGQPELVASWLESSLWEHSLGLTPQQWQQFWENLTPMQRQLIELLKAEETLEEIAKNLKLKTHQVIDEWKKLYLAAQALRSGDAIPAQEAEATVSYEVLLTSLPDSVPVGGKIQVTIYLNPASANKSNDYLLEVPIEEIASEDLVIFLTAPGFRFDGDNVTSLLLELEPNNNISIGQFIQAANFRLTALRSGTAIITAELYRGNTFETNLEAKVQVTGFDEASFTELALLPNPVPSLNPTSFSESNRLE